MKIAVIGAGAMCSVMGACLAQSGNDVTLIDVWHEAIDKINSDGLRVDDKSGNSNVIRIRAADRPVEVGPVDLVLVFVKCYQTEKAVKSAQRMTEIDVINGAIVDAGRQLNLPTPYNQSMVWIIKSLEGMFPPSAKS